MLIYLLSYVKIALLNLKLTFLLDIKALNVVGKTITGAFSGENASCVAEGFTISGKRTEG